MKAIWDSTIDSASGEVFIDVQIWYADLIPPPLPPILL